MSNLIKFREQQNLTQEELAEKSGISVRTIQRIEAGTQPKGYTLKVLAIALEISEEELSQKAFKQSIYESQVPLTEKETLIKNTVKDESSDRLLYKL